MTASNRNFVSSLTAIFSHGRADLDGNVCESARVVIHSYDNEAKIVEDSLEIEIDTS
jgi:hypothetical protein